MKVSCLIPAATAAGTTNTIVDYGQARWHNGAGRTTAADGHTTAASAVVTSATAHFLASDKNHQITSSLAGIPVGAFIKVVTNATTVTLNVNATATQTLGVLTVENSSARHVTNAVRTNASATLTSATANFSGGDLNALVTGTGIKPGTKISVVGSSTSVTLSQTASSTGTGGYLTINSVLQASSNRQVSDLHSPAAAASTTIVSATAGFTATDVGLPVVGVGTGWPAGAYIASVTNASNAVLSAAATLGVTANRIATIGKPDFGAPTNGSVVSQLSAELHLSPGLVASADDCTNNTPEGFQIQGTWQNPGSFSTGGVIVAAPSNSIAQIVYGNVSASFAAYVVRSLTGTYTISYPFLPTALAACASKPIATAFTFGGITGGQSNLVTGAAAPNTASVRGYADFIGATAPTNTAGTVKVGTNAVITLTACPVSRLLNGPTSWVCGQG